MLFQMTQGGSTLLLLLVLVLAAYTDMRRNRIPNWLSLGALVTGLLLSYLFLPEGEIHNGLKGAGVGLALFLPFYLAGGMGAGDVKLMAAVGSFMGPVPAFMTVCFTLMVGGCAALWIILRNGELVSFYRRYLVMLTARVHIPAEEGSVAKRRFPYALSIAIGTLIYLGFDGQLKFTQWSTLIGNQLQALGVMQ